MADKNILFITELFGWVALGLTTLAWYEVNGLLWSYSLIILFPLLYFNSIHNYPYFSNNKKNLCDNGEMGYTIANGIKIFSMVLAIIGIFVFILNEKQWSTIAVIIEKNVTNITPDIDCKTTAKCTPFIWYWIFFLFASILYLLNGIILLIVLMQCGATDWRNIDKDSEKDNKLKDNKKIILFREIVHDIVLGIFWVILSIRFVDVVDDYDDKMWRSLFSSMICFHLIIILWKLWDTPSLVIDKKDPEFKCCYAKTIPIWFAIGRFSCYGVLYYVLLYRIHSEEFLVSMGIPLELFILSIVFIVFIIIITTLEHTEWYNNYIHGYSTKTVNHHAEISNHRVGALKF
tara:strand:- start:16 stop:1053 length:1038 start_codon:yes stop_codon:yes gene_type:complete